jgi:hypothetical protein
LGGRADAEQEGNFDEDEDEAGDAGRLLAGGCCLLGYLYGTYKRRTLQRMMISKWKMLAMPSAKQRIMQSTPVLMESVSFDTTDRNAPAVVPARTIVRIYL